MHIEPAGEHIGAIVTGVDVARLTQPEWQELYRAWLDHSVLVVRDQELDIASFLDYGRRFGRVKPHLVRKARHPDHPDLTVMGLGTRTQDGSVNKSVYNRGQGWHTDGP